MPKIFEPKLVTVLREGYSLNRFVHDLIAGVIVGIVALPLAIAFAVASGVNPEQGLYTAIVAGLVISVLSGSRVQIGGPTGAFIVIVFQIVQNYGYEGLAVATLMAGFILILMGIARMGDVIKFIPYPVTVGFTSGIALIIFTTQIVDFLGISGVPIPKEFGEKWLMLMTHLLDANGYAVAVGGLTILIINYWPKLTTKIPGSLVAIIVTTGLVHVLQWPVETIGSRFGSVPNTLPQFQFPHLSWELIVTMIGPAITIALLAGVESLLSAVVADGMTGYRHRSNMELIAQGVANIFSPLFGGIPATGAIARTATNIKSGGRTPLAGIIHAVTLLLILLIFGNLATMIPMAALAGILIIVAYNMSEIRLFVKLFRSPKSDVIVLLTTFLLTVLVDLTVAIEVGVVMASFLFMKRMVDVTQVGYITRTMDGNENGAEDAEWLQKDIPPDVAVFEINGPFFFGAADKFKNTLRNVQHKQSVLILSMRYVPVMDATALRALEDVVEKARKDGIAVMLAGVQTQPRRLLEQAGLTQRIGRENIHLNIDVALAQARLFIKKGKPDS
jgi:SulP family sulfate permease